MNRIVLFFKGGIPLFFILVMCSSQSFGQAVGDYRSTASGTWTTVGNWQRFNGTAWVTVTTASGFGYPGQNTATANVTILSNNSITLNVSPAMGIPSLQLGSKTSDSTGTLVFNNNRLLTVGGAVTVGNGATLSSGTITMTNGGTLSVNSIVVSNAAGSVFTPGAGAAVDTVQFNATNTLPTSVFTTFNNITFSGGTTTASGNLTIAGSLTLNSGGTFNDGGLTHSIGRNWVNNGGTFISTGTIDFNSTIINQQINGTATSQAFNNVIEDNGAFTLTTAGSITAVSVGAALTVTSGTFTVAAITFSVAGATSISGTLRISSAINTKTFASLITVNTGGLWNNSGNSPVTVQGGITNNGTFTAGSGGYTFNTNSQALTGTLVIPKDTVTAITLTNNGTLTVATVLTGTGTLLQGLNAILNLGGSSANIGLQATTNSNTVNYTGASQTINATNYDTLTLSGSGTDIMQSGTTSIAGNFTLSGTVRTTTADNLAIAGNLIIGDATILTIGAFGLTVTGTTTIGSGTSGRITISSATGAKTFVGLIRVNSGGLWVNNTGNSDVTVRGGITNSGTFTSGTGIYTFDTKNQVLNGTFAIPNVTVTGVNLTNSNTLTVATALTGSGTLIQANNAALNIGGTSLTITLQTATGDTVSYTGAAQTVNPANYYNLTFSGSGVKTMQAATTSIAGNFILAGTARATPAASLTIGGNFILGTGTRFTAGTFTYSVLGNWTNNGTTFITSTSTIAFNGASAQTIGGTAATTFANLTINNAAGVTLDDGTNSTNKTVTGVLSLSNGYLTTTLSNLLVINSGATTTVANAVAGVPQATSPYVNGPMNKLGTQAFIFPVGSLGTGCVPIGISAPSVTATFQAQYVRANPVTTLGDSITAPNLFNLSVCEYWNLNLLAGAPTVNVTAYWNANNPCNGEAPGGYVTDISTIALAHFNGTVWNSSTPVPAFTLGGSVTGSVTWLGVSTFSPFTLGNNSSAKENPLNIKLDYFTAVKANGYNTLTWKAECTSSSNLFEAQRSVDGMHYTSIDSVRVDAASDCSQAFVYNDYSIAGNKIYYRIKTTDITGNIGYSEIILISNQASTLQFISINPNPVRSDASLSISSPQNDKVELVILSIDGKELQHKTVQVLAGSSIISLQTNSLAKGMYILKGIFSGGQTNTIKFVKQ